MFTDPAHLEQDRLGRLYETRLLDSPFEKEYDDLLRLAVQLCGAQKGAITFVDDQRVFHKSSVGFSPAQLTRAESLCDHIVRRGSALIVEDLLQDERFSSKALVIESGLRFYAGVPLATQDGFTLGTLSVLDDSPRCLSEDEKRNLESIARQINSTIELRVERERSERLLKHLELQRSLFETYFHSIPVESCLKDANGCILIYNQALAKRFKISLTDWIGKTSEELWPPTVAAQIIGEDAEIWKNGKAHTKYITVPYQGVVNHWRYTRVPCRASEGQAVMLCISVDVSTEVQQRLDVEQERSGLASAAAQMRERLQRDDLTGLHNRTSFEASCLSALFELKSSGKHFGVLSFDIGALAMFNRMYGTNEVDELLRQVADALLRDREENEIAARVAGGSYRLIVKAATAQSIEAVAKRIEREIGNILWRGKVMSPAVRSQMFCDRQMHPGDLYATPRLLVTEKSGSAKKVRQSATYRAEDSISRGFFS